jgi:hypothetical protein
LSEFQEQANAQVSEELQTLHEANLCESSALRMSNFEDICRLIISQEETISKSSEK